MILTVGHNYCKLNDSVDFYNMMNALYASQGGGDVEFTYDSGTDYGLSAGTLGYVISDFHFKFLPVGTRFHNLTTGAVTEKISNWDQNFGFQMYGANTYTNPGGQYTNGFLILGHEYDIRIPAKYGKFNTGYTELQTNLPDNRYIFDQHFRSDLAAVNGYYPKAGGATRTDLFDSDLDLGAKYRCGLPFLVPIMEREKSVLHKVFPDEVSKPENNVESQINHESYWVVYGGEPKPLQECEEIMNLTIRDVEVPFADTGDLFVPEDDPMAPPSGLSIGKVVASQMVGTTPKYKFNVDADTLGSSFNHQYPLAQGPRYTPRSPRRGAETLATQSPPGIVSVGWAGHYPGHPFDIDVSDTAAFDDGLNLPIVDNFIYQKDFIVPDIRGISGGFHNGTGYHPGVAGPHISSEGIEEQFWNKDNAAMIESRRMDRVSTYPLTTFKWGELEGKMHNAIHQQPYGAEVSQFTNKKYAQNPYPGGSGYIWQNPDGFYAGSEPSTETLPELYLQPGNIYRIDIRFPVGEGTIDLGPDFARLFYSDDPLGDTGFRLLSDQVGTMTGYSRKTLEFLPFIRNNGEVQGFELTSWKTNPASSYQQLGDYSTANPIYFEDYNVVPYVQDYSTGEFVPDKPHPNPNYPYGILNSVDIQFWNNVGRPDVVEELVQIVTRQKELPPPKNPVYFEDFDQAGGTELNNLGFKGDGFLNSSDVIFWASLGRQDIADQISGFITSENMPPKRAEIGTSDQYPGSGNYGGGIYNLSSSMDGDYTTQLLQSGQMDTPDSVFEQLPTLPLQPWGLRYFEDLKAFGVLNMPFDGNIESGNALRNYDETIYLTAGNNDPYSEPIMQVYGMDGKYRNRGGGSENWYGNLMEIELGKAYDIGIESIPGQDFLVFRNPYLANETEEYGPHTVLLYPGQYVTVTFTDIESDEDFTFSEDDIGAWAQIQNETGEYTGHVQDWIRRYISIREGGYGTNVSTFNQTYLPRSTSGLAEFGPLKPGYTSPPAMNEYPLIPNGLAYLEDFGNPSNDAVINMGQFVGLGYPDYADWLAQYEVDAQNYNHIPPSSPIGDGLPVFGPKAIAGGLMTLINSNNWNSVMTALNFTLVKPGPNATWQPIAGQQQILPYSSGSYNIEYVMDTRGEDGQTQEVQRDGSFTIFGSSGTYPNHTLNPSDVAVYYKGNGTSPDDTDSYIPSGWYIPRTSPIFANGLGANKAYYIQHQLPHSVYLISDQIELNRTQAATAVHRTQYSAHNSGLCSDGSGYDGQKFVELPPRTLTEIYFEPLPGPSWVQPDGGDGIINEWVIGGSGFPILREKLNINVPYLRDTEISVAEVLGHIGCPIDRIAGILEQRDVLEDGRYANDTVRYIIPPVASSQEYQTGNYSVSDWVGTLSTFQPGKLYNIYIWDEYDEGTEWIFFGNVGNLELDNNYFPTMPAGIDEWQDFDIDGDGIVSIEDWNLWASPPSGPARPDIQDYIQGFLTNKDWLIYFSSPPVQTEPYFEQVELVDVNIPLITPDGQEKKNVTEKEVTINYWPTGSYPKGSQIFTGSARSSRKDYYINVLSDHPNSSSADFLFDVSFGHYEGSGSKVGVSGIGATKAIYKTQLSNLEDVEKLEFEQQPGKDLGFHISSGSNEVDKYIWSVNFHRKKYGDRLSKGNWTLKLSGSKADGTGTKTLKLTDDSRQQDGTVTPAGKRYNIKSGSSGTLNTSDTKTYGWYYPEAGTMILGENMSTLIPGPHTSNAASTASVATYSHKTDATRKNSSGFYLNYGPTNAANSFKDQNYNNSLRLVNCMRNVSDTSGSILEGLTGVEDQTCVTYLCNIKPHQLNHSNNPTYTSYEYYESTGSIDFQPFYMMRNASMHGNPQTYVTQVNLHDDAGNVLATARLSKPMHKSFDKEAIIKVKLSY